MRSAAFLCPASGRNPNTACIGGELQPQSRKWYCGAIFPSGTGNYTVLLLHNQAVREGYWTTTSNCFHIMKVNVK
jgi:hypothetical protein